jgi:2,5-diamino-6-(ribosylamino)-4(3H)-pyrimidinone 5'-phosphate reductase
MTPLSARPRVICHMAASIDGRIDVDGWPADVAAAVRGHYDEVHAGYAAEGWICGRVTMEPFAKGMRSDEDVAREYEGSEPREDFHAAGEFDSFAFAVDPSGRLAWETNDIGGDHVVSILTARVSDEYLRFLREHGVSYILAGARELDFNLALQKIRAEFDVATLMLEGGGKINGAMLRAGLVDEVSLLVAPVADGRSGNPALLDVPGESGTRQRLTLERVEARGDDILWVRYRVEGMPLVGP